MPYMARAGRTDHDTHETVLSGLPKEATVQDENDGGDSQDSEFFTDAEHLETKKNRPGRTGIPDQLSRPQGESRQVDNKISDTDDEGGKKRIEIDQHQDKKKPCEELAGLSSKEKLFKYLHKLFALFIPHDHSP